MALTPPTLGKHPKDERLARIKKSPNYKDGEFVNLSPTPMMADEVSYWKMISWYTWKKPVTTPPKPIPSVKSDLKAPLADDSKPVITWFGHSSYLLQIDGQNILVDPVFSGYASPFKTLGIKSYEGSNVYQLSDLPEIDIVLLSHDHYDHLDYNVILQLKSKVKKFVIPLGVGAHLEYWGVPTEAIEEYDWWEGGKLSTTLQITCTPARHFSGRSFKRGRSLWASYVIQSNNYKIYIGGDSGYDSHFELIGKKYGPFDLAILECGQYNAYWKFIHMMPEQTAQAGIDLQAKLVLPVHWGKFSLSVHPWDESITRFTKAAQELKLNYTTPLIGEQIKLDTIIPHSRWWENL
jgi:L-ascorbate metabolism protein UlaG (beta-lactamase superfamily)